MENFLVVPGTGIIECSFVYVDRIFVGLGMKSEPSFRIEQFQGVPHGRMRERDGFCLERGELNEAGGGSEIVVVHNVRSGWVCREGGVRDAVGYGRGE